MELKTYRVMDAMELDELVKERILPDDNWSFYDDHEEGAYIFNDINAGIVAKNSFVHNSQTPRSMLIRLAVAGVLPASNYLIIVE